MMQILLLKLEVRVFLNIDYDSSDRILTDPTYITKENKKESIPYKKDLLDYLQLLNNEYDDQMELVSISLKKQNLQLEERLILKRIQIRRYKRNLKEQLIKSAQNKLLVQKPIPFNSNYTKNEAKFMLNTCVKFKLEATAKRLLEKCEPEEDEEEIIELVDTPTNVEAVNIMYNEKKQEILKAMEDFGKMIENCKNRKLPEKVMEKLQEKEIKTISKISQKFAIKM